jgi:hypothetical protein
MVLALWGIGWALTPCGCAQYDLGAKAAPRMVEARVALDGTPPTLGATTAAAGGQPEKLDPALQQRLLVYNATLGLTVDRIAYAIEQAKTIAEKAGGYVHQMSTDSATLRVPAAKFHEVLGQLLQLGRVAHKQVTGTDVTEQYRDLHIRLDNAEKLRGRLVQLLDKAQKVEEMLKVEQELGRVTEDVELLKGKARHLEHNVAFSTLTVQFTSSIPQEQFDTRIPFAWVNDLGRDLVRGESGRPHEARAEWALVAIALPPSYVKYYEWDYTTRAMSADGVMIQVRRLANYRGGTAEFWHGLVRRALVDEQHFTLGEDKTVAVHGGVARLLALQKVIGAQPHAYLVAVAATEHHVYVFEAWGHEDKVKAARAGLEAALGTMRLGWWRQLLWHLF